MITYKPTKSNPAKIQVRLDDILHGWIVLADSGYRYRTTQRSVGPVFKTIAEVKKSLED